MIMFFLVPFGPWVVRVTVDHVQARRGAKQRNPRVVFTRVFCAIVTVEIVGMVCFCFTASFGFSVSN